jgi:hypothetical protein
MGIYSNIGGYIGVYWEKCGAVGAVGAVALFRRFAKMSFYVRFYCSIIIAWRAGPKGFGSFFMLIFRPA